jgi:PPM family protein phosphatase
MKYAAKTIAGIRKQNQDAVFIPEQGMIAIAAVADGMGGHNAGDVASELAIKTLVESMHKIMPGSVGERLIHAVNMANSAVYEMSLTNDEYRGMGTTLVAAVLEKNGFTAANIGDSRLYHYDGKELKQITKDHSYVAQLEALGYITKEEAARHPQRNIITRAVGTRPAERADVFECSWEKEDKILICTDGLYGVLSENEIIDNLGCTAENLQTACENLVDLAFEAGSRDNISAVIIYNDGE